MKFARSNRPPKKAQVKEKFNDFVDAVHENESEIAQLVFGKIVDLIAIIACIVGLAIIVQWILGALI